MRRTVARLLVISLCALAAAAAATSLVFQGSYVRSEDRNGDGRPDEWRTYDGEHRLLEVAVDTNFDGRSDVREFYDRDALVRRESDRDFDDRVDLVEEFDPTTRERVRSIVDVDDDGRADLLVLFSGGEAVFSKWAAPATVASGRLPGLADIAPFRPGSARLLPLLDPFSSETAIGSVRLLAKPAEWVGLSAAAGLPERTFTVVRVPAPEGRLLPSQPALWDAALEGVSPRGPPASL